MCTSEMPSTQPSDNVQDDEYTQLFEQLIARSLTAAASSIVPGVIVLTDEIRNRALYSLGFALQLRKLWPQSAQLLLQIAPYLEKAGYWEEWLPHLMQGAAMSRLCGDHRTLAELQLQISFIYQLQSKFEQAIVHCHASAEEFSQIGDRGNQARALNQQAFIAQVQRRFGDARDFAHKALTLLPEEDTRRATSHVALGWVALDHMDFHTAELHFTQALHLWEKAEDQRQIARRLRDLGDLFQLQNRYEQGFLYYDKALTLFIEVDDRYEQAVTRMNLAMLYWASADYERADALLALAEPILRELQDIRHLAMVYNNQALVFRNLHQWEKAQDAFSASLIRWKQLGNVNAVVEVLEELGITYLEQQKLGEAAVNFQEALVLITQMADDPNYQQRLESIEAHLAQAQMNSAI